jgi:hypothetical protein
VQAALNHEVRPVETRAVVKPSPDALGDVLARDLESSAHSPPDTHDRRHGASGDETGLKTPSLTGFATYENTVVDWLRNVPGQSLGAAQA